MRSDVPRYVAIAEEMMAQAEGAEPGAQARALRVMGNSLRIRGQLQEARRVLDRSVACWQEAGDEIEWARTHTTMVPVLIQLGKHQDALVASNAGLEVFVRQNQPLPAARLLSNTAAIYYFMGRPQDALNCYTRAEELAGQGADEGLRSRLSLNRAVALQQLGEYVESLRVCAPSLRYSLKTRQYVSAAKVLQAGATALFHLGRFGKALRRFARARSMFASQSSPRDVAVCDLYICACYVELNRFDQVLTRARAVLSQLDPADGGFQLASARFYEGVALVRRGYRSEGLISIEEAGRWFEQNGYRPWAAWANLEEAEVFLAQGAGRFAVRRAAKAGRLFRAARMPVEEARALLVAAEGYRIVRRASLAEQAAHRSHEIFTRHRIPGPLFRCMHLLGRIALERNDFSTARLWLEKAVQTAERMRSTVQVAFRKAFLDDKASAYADLVWLHLKEGRVRVAHRLADRAKSRALVDALSGSSEYRKGSLPAEDQRLLAQIEAVRQEYQELVRPLRLGPEEGATLRGGMASLTARRTELEQRLTALWDEWELRQAANVSGPGLNGFATSRLDQRLKPGGCLVEYFVANNRVLAFVSGRRGLLGWVDLGSPDPVRRSLELLQLNLDAGLQRVAETSPALVRNARALLRELYRRLWAPLGALVGRKRQCVVIPHGFLHLIPFEALYDGRSYLVQSCEFTMAPSREAWLRCLERADRLAAGRAFVMGYNPDGLLPYVEEEVRQVAATLQTGPTLGERATVDSLNGTRDSRIIHLAVHGEFREDNPYFSTLLLADGPFTASDAASLRLSASLVVLSGCETGLSRVTRGDELVGLISAFLHAGSASVLASRWRVEDRLTAELMQTFYERLLGGLGKAAALRDAQAAMAARDIHPLFWAAFCMIGHGGSMQL